MPLPFPLRARGQPPAGVPPVAVDGSRVAWLPWGTEAFTRAQATGRPVLLWLTTTWSAACHAMARDVFAEPALARLIGEATVPVRVDADRRPDIAERYTHGGWPTTLLLTPEGDPLAGGTYLDADGLRALVTRVAGVLASRRQELAREAQQARDLRLAAVAREADADAHADAEREADPDADTGADARAHGDAEAAHLAWIRHRLLDAFDRDHGGFGRAAKFPLAAPIAFALWQGTRAHDDALVDVALVTLDRMAAGPLSAADGAFHRACAAPDWSAPDEAKLLETQAELIPLYLDAETITGAAAYRERAAAAIAFVCATLADHARGGFFASQAPDGSIDRVLPIDANAKMIVALLQAARLLDDASLAARAAQAIERIVPSAYLPRAGVAHLLAPSPDPGGPDVAQVRGLLADQVHASAALLEAAVSLGESTYAELAEELMRSVLRKLWHPSGGLVDRLRSAAGAGDVGLLGEPLRPLAANAAAARVLVRLVRDADRQDLLDPAEATLRALRRVYRQHDVLAAEFGLALLATLAT